MVCGSPLTYLEYGHEYRCTRCGRVESGHVVCPNGHFLCENCHNKESLRVIREYCLASDSADPFEISEYLINIPSLPMLGCHHAYIAAGSLIAALKNEGTIRVRDSHMEEVFDRIQRQAISGYCGLTGVCGIVVAMGACVAVILSSKCGSNEEQYLAMDMACSVALAIKELTGPSCCKAYVRSAIDEAVKFFAANFGLYLGGSTNISSCRHIERHPHGCRMELCPYFENKYQDR